MGTSTQPGARVQQDAASQATDETIEQNADAAHGPPVEEGTAPAGRRPVLDPTLPDGAIVRGPTRRRRWRSQDI